MDAGRSLYPIRSMRVLKLMGPAAGGIALAVIVTLVVGVAVVRSGAPARHTESVKPKPTATPTPLTTPTPTPAKVPIAIVPRGRPSIKVPILMYHYIRNNPDPADRLGYGLSVTPNDFRAQVGWLYGNGYHAIDFEDLRGYFAGLNDLPPKPVMLTFDDGNADLYTTAFPILRAHHFKAVAYIVSGFLGARDRVTREQVQELDAGGVEIAAHTVSHLDMTTLPGPRLQREVTQCRQELEAVVGHPVLDFAYPAGRHNPVVERAVAQAGFQTAVTTELGTTHDWAGRLTWTRVRVEGGEPLERFIGNLGAPEPTVTVPGDAPTPTPARKGFYP
jgi:peptidoglycan/xylan/chitin deacetylase (PgdA/CDA1 family)